MPKNPYFYDYYSGKRRNYLSEEALLEIANKIRAAGGGKILDAFFPSEPGVENACLIANALNFGCRVAPRLPYLPFMASAERWASGASKWTMEVPTAKLAKMLADDLNWDIVDVPHYRNFIILPELVGNTAEAFDLGKGWTAKYAKKTED